MANKNNMIWMILILIIAIFALFYFFGNQEKSIIILKENPNTQQDDTCADYHISAEFRDHFTDLVIDGTRKACLNTSGSWFESSGEIACDYPFPRDLPCDSTYAIQASDYCVNELEAHWRCNELLGYVGCYCNKQSEAELEFGEEDINCGDGQDNDGDGLVDCYDSDCDCEYSCEIYAWYAEEQCIHGTCPEGRICQLNLQGDNCICMTVLI